jgi:hypothetical protein
VVEAKECSFSRMANSEIRTPKKDDPMSSVEAVEIVVLRRQLLTQNQFFQYKFRVIFK